MTNKSDKYETRKIIGLFLGLVLLLIILLLPVPQGLKPSGMAMAAVAALMITWWVTEALPIGATSLIPVALYPILGIMASKKVTLNYGNHLIFLFIGGFIIAIAMQKHNLHRRIALHTIKLVGTSSHRLVLGFMIATAFLSMWISNTATTMMMVPVAIALALQVASEAKYKGKSGPATEEVVKQNFGLVLMLSISYAASIGGMATLVGTPPNIAFIGLFKKLYPQGPEISFAKWMVVAFPVVVVFIPAAWYYLTRFASPIKLRDMELSGGKRVIDEELHKLGPMSTAEKWVLIVFVATALLWIFRRPIKTGLFTIPGWSQLFGAYAKYISDATVAMFTSLSMFLMPLNFKRGEFVIDWKSVAQGIPWGAIFLFGGAFAFAAGLRDSGLAMWSGNKIAVAASTVSPFVLVIIGVTVLVFFTEVTTNLASIITFAPILGVMAVGIDLNPLLVLIPATLAASTAFMLPVATPPNVIIYGSGWVPIARMAKAGFLMNIMAIIIISFIGYFLITSVYDISIGLLPVWAK